jgi:hypothetical protein
MKQESNTCIRKSAKGRLDVGEFQQTAVPSLLAAWPVTKMHCRAAHSSSSYLRMNSFLPQVIWEKLHIPFNNSLRIELRGVEKQERRPKN